MEFSYERPKIRRRERGGFDNLAIGPLDNEVSGQAGRMHGVFPRSECKILIPELAHVGFMHTVEGFWESGKQAGRAVVQPDGRPRQVGPEDAAR